jgi:hypothetical protein
MRDLFYSLALLSSEDIGMRAGIRDDEPVDRDRCERPASGWLAHPREDPDLGVDTRVSVPICADPGRRVTRLRATPGVRLTRLTAGFARPPRIRPEGGKVSGGSQVAGPPDTSAILREGEEPDGWLVVEPYRLGTSYSLVPVDEFAEVEPRGDRVLTRKELRAACDAREEKGAIISALGR